MAAQLLLPRAAPTGNSGSAEVAVIPVELSERTDSHTPPDVEAPVVSEQPEHEEQPGADPGFFQGGFNFSHPTHNDEMMTSLWSTSQQ